MVQQGRDDMMPPLIALFYMLVSLSAVGPLVGVLIAWSNVRLLTGGEPIPLAVANARAVRWVFGFHWSAVALVLADVAHLRVSRALLTVLFVHVTIGLLVKALWIANFRRKDPPNDVR